MTDQAGSRKIRDESHCLSGEEGGNFGDPTLTYRVEWGSSENRHTIEQKIEGMTYSGKNVLYHKIEHMFTNSIFYFGASRESLAEKLP